MGISSKSRRRYFGGCPGNLETWTCVWLLSNFPTLWYIAHGEEHKIRGVAK